MKVVTVLKTAIIVSSAWLLGMLVGSAQVREAWVAHFPEDGEPFTDLSASILDTQGNPVVTGTSGLDCVTVKYDRDTGQIIWIARYDNGYQDYATAIAMDANGDVIVTGLSRGVGTNIDFVTIKYDAQTGQQQWSTRYNGTVNGNDAAYTLGVDAQGDVFVAGSSAGVGNNLDYMTIKYKGQTGRQLWAARYSTSANEVVRAIAIDQAGHAFVTGNSGTIKYHGQTGQTIWGPVLSDGRGMVLDPSGNVSVVGGTGILNVYRFHGQTGQTLWAASIQSFGGSGSKVVVDTFGDPCIISSLGSNERSIIAKFSGQTGQLLWAHSLQGGMGAFVSDQAGDYYATGASQGTFPGPVGDFRTVKLDGHTGDLLWMRTYANAIGRAIVVDEQGNLYASGYLGSDGTRSERYLTIKYEQAPPGDVDFDFCVDDGDLLRVLEVFGQSGDLPEDVNRDGVVDDKDLLTVLFHFGRGCGTDS